MTPRAWVALIGILVGALGLAIDFSVISDTMAASAANPVARSLPNMLVYYWTFLTNLGNLGLILAYIADLTGWDWLGWFRQPVTRAGMAGLIVLIMCYYGIVLAPDLADLTGPIVLSNTLLHYVTPLLYLGWWGAFVAHGMLRYRDVPLMLLPGVLYVAYVLLRGPVAGEYPYTILDPTFAPTGGAAQGYAGVGIGVLVLVVLVALFDALLVLVDGLLGPAGEAGMKLVATWIGFALGTAGLLLQFGLAMVARLATGDGIVGALVFFFTFLTILTNLALVLIYASELWPRPSLRWFREPVTRGMMAGLMTLVCIFYHLVLAETWDPHGFHLVADVTLHYATPIFYVLWWALFARHGMLKFGDVPQMLVPPTIYLVYVMIRGAIVDEYPYTILEAGRIGYTQVAANVAGVLVGLVAFCAIAVAVDRMLVRTRQPGG